MEKEMVKCVMVLNEALPLGIIANVSGILGATLGKYVPEMIGADVTDGEGKLHTGIIKTPVPVLKGSSESIKHLREKLYGEEFCELFTVDFSDVAQGCLTYEEYTEKAARSTGEAFRYLGVAIYGNKKKVNKLTGSMPLLR